MIKVENLSKSFGNVQALRDVTFSADRGQIVGILGPNGAGKTTALRILCGFLSPSSGQASVDGLDTSEQSLEVRSRIGFLPENNPLYPEMFVADYLRYRARIKGVARSRVRERVAEVSDRCGLSTVLSRPISVLSKGFRQRVGLADALIAGPPLLILDEPTVGLDPNQVIEVRSLIDELRGSHTVLISSHILSEIEQVCDRVVIFRDGEVVAEGDTQSLGVGVSGLQRITVEVRGENIDELFDGLGNVLRRELIDDDWVRVTLESESDCRTSLFERAVEKRLTLRELKLRSRSLEQVFHELTLADSPPQRVDR